MRWPRINKKYPEIQRDENTDHYGYLTLRVSTNFDGQPWAEQYSLSPEFVKNPPKIGDNFDTKDNLFIDHIGVVFDKLEESIKRRIEEEISARTKKMVDQLLNISPN